MKKIQWVSACAFVFAVVTVAFAIGVGSTVSDVQVRDSNNQPASIPDLGKKVVTIFYNDTTAADYTDPIATAIKNKKYPEAKYRGQGIANLADSRGVPNAVIRWIVRKKERQYDTKILTDPDYLLKNAWNLGDCNDKGIVIVIGKDRVVRYFNKITSIDHGKAEVSKVLAVIEAEIEKIK